MSFVKDGPKALHNIYSSWGNAESWLLRVLTCKKHEPAFKVTPRTLKGKVQPKIKTIKNVFSFHPSAVYMDNIEL